MECSRTDEVAIITGRSSDDKRRPNSDDDVVPNESITAISRSGSDRTPKERERERERERNATNPSGSILSLRGATFREVWRLGFFFSSLRFGLPSCSRRLVVPVFFFFFQLVSNHNLPSKQDRVFRLRLRSTWNETEREKEECDETVKKTKGTSQMTSNHQQVTIVKL